MRFFLSLLLILCFGTASHGSLSALVESPSFVQAALYTAKPKQLAQFYEKHKLPPFAPIELSGRVLLVNPHMTIVPLYPNETPPSSLSGLIRYTQTQNRKHTWQLDPLKNFGRSEVLIPAIAFQALQPKTSSTMMSFLRVGHLGKSLKFFQDITWVSKTRPIGPTLYTADIPNLTIVMTEITAQDHMAPRLDLVLNVPTWVLFGDLPTSWMHVEQEQDPDGRSVYIFTGIDLD